MPRRASSARCRLGRQVLVFNYTAAGFVPAMIRPQPTEDLSAITFLGERIATSIRSSRAGARSPARFEYESRHRAAGSLPAGTGTRPRIHVSRSSRATRIRTRSACMHDSAIRSDSARVHVTGSYRPDDALSSKEPRAPAAIRFEHEFWRQGSTGTPAISTTCSVRPSEAARATALRGLRPADHLPAAGDDAREREGWPTTATSTRCQTFRMSPSPSDKLFTGEVGLEHQNVRSSIGNVDDETGFTWGAARARLRRRRRRRARARGTVRRRIRAAARAFLDMVA